MGKYTQRLRLKEKKADLIAVRQVSLQNALPLPPTQVGRGRGSACIFNDCVVQCGHPPAYRESHRLSSIAHSGHRNAVERIRDGQVACAVESAKRNPAAALGCRCGAEVEDAKHTVLECPLNLTRREAILDHIRVASDSDPVLHQLTRGQLDSSILLASLGAELPGVYLPADAAEYGALMGLAAPQWAKQFEHLLT